MIFNCKQFYYEFSKTYTCGSVLNQSSMLRFCHIFHISVLFMCWGMVSLTLYLCLPMRWMRSYCLAQVLTANTQIDSPLGSSLEYRWENLLKLLINKTKYWGKLAFKLFSESVVYSWWMDKCNVRVEILSVFNKKK